ncbi:MAG: trimeric intracellular cation channel family protein [Canibacter sp.]
MQTFHIPLWLDLSAAGIGSLQGALFAAGFKRLDLLGVAVIAISCGLGGGFFRDLLINDTPASLSSNWYLVVCVAAGLFGMLLQRLLVKVDPIINLLTRLLLECLLPWARLRHFLQDSLLSHRFLSAQSLLSAEGYYAICC